MRPALLQVAARCRAGEWPSEREVGALLAESRVPGGEAADLTRRYAAAIHAMAAMAGAPVATSGEAGVLATLRSFSLRP
jgi:hypothetical protein